LGRNQVSRRWTKVASGEEPASSLPASENLHKTGY